MCDRFRWPAVACALLMTLRATTGLAAEPVQAAFEAAVQAVTQAQTPVPEQQVIEMLKVSREAGRPMAANAALKTWLSRQRTPSPGMLLAAADHAALSGDLKTAAARYKAFLEAAPADEARSRVAARLYALVINDLANPADAYTFMARNHAGMRQSFEARQYDPWFFDQAMARGDVAPAAAIATAVLAEKMPLEQERVFWWDRIDALMANLARAQAGQFPALAAAKQIPGLLRDSPQRAARYAFIVAWLEYRAGSAGKDPAALAAAFAPVAAAATAYVDAAPTAAVLADVQNVMFCGAGTFAVWPPAPVFQDWWTAAFSKLSDAEKPKAINWNGWWAQQATPAQWIELGAKFPQVFRTAAATASLPALSNAPDPAIYAKQATFLAGVTSDAAKLANALAASKGTDLAAAGRHLVTAESWHGGFDSTLRVANQLWPIWRAFPRQPAATDADGQKALLAWGAEGIVRSPLAIFDPPAAGAYLVTAFQAGGPDPADKAHVAATLRSLDWVPWDAAARKSVVKPAHDAFNQWAGQVRQQLAAVAKEKDPAKQAEKQKWEKAAAQIGPLEEEFKKAFDPGVSATADLAKAADPLAGHLARCVQAARAKNLEAYLTAARAAYPLVREYAEKKTPFGGPALAWLLTNHDGLDLTPFQCEVITDQFQSWAPGKPSALLPSIDTSLASGRPGGNWQGPVPKKFAAQAVAINAVIGKGIVALLDKGQFDIAIFNRFRQSRMGPGWRDDNAGSDVMAKLIDSKAFLVHKQRLGVHPSATADYQWLIRNEFPALAAKYPPESSFDDMFVEEFKGRNWFDAAFLNYSRDDKKKAAALAAETLAGFTSVATGPGNPLGFDQLPWILPAGDRRDVATRDGFWTRGEFDRWQGQATSAPPPLNSKLVTAADAAWGKTRFDAAALGYAFLPGDPAAIQNAEARKAFFARLAGIMERRSREYPDRSGMPYLGALNGLAPGSFAPEERAILLAAIETCPPPLWSGGYGHEQLGLLVAGSLDTAGDRLRLAAIAPELWRIGRDTRSLDYLGRLTALTAGLARGGQLDIAGAIASAGVEMLGADVPEGIRKQLGVIRGDALMATGGTNPVPRSDPRWPVFEAQLAFAAGKPQSAWDLYLPAAAVAAPMHRDLNADFVTWLIRENTATSNFDRARELGQLMLSWTESTPGALDAESQAAVLVAYADIALARREYAQARALYERLVAAKEFDGTAGKRDAELRVAEVDRVSRQYDRAQELLEKLVRRPDRSLQADAYYQLALLKADQEELEEAAAFLEEVFARFPGHVGGRILEGKLNLLRRKYDVASKVKLGVLGDKKYLIPGKPLEVDLEDKNLAMVGKATQIEIRAWTAGGDEERFLILPFGDSKTRFTGSLPTQLGAAVKGDRVLQVLGGDTVNYAFAESFQGARELAEQPAALTVVTDADLFASSGEILSKEEQEARALELAIRTRLKVEDAATQELLLSTMRREDQIKPGNPLNIRVLDPDRSTTVGQDTLPVRVATSSGDALTATLKETQPFSGVFEGAVRTGASQAIAYATDSADGADPNGTIGPASDTPWVALPDNVRPKLFAVDLNDNVALGTMTVKSAVPGRKLKDVYVQTSLNGRDFVTRGQWRADGKATFVPWNGGPRVDLARATPPGGALPKLDKPEDFVAYLESGRLASGSRLLSEPLPTLAFGPLDHGLGGRAVKIDLQHLHAFVGHWRAAFEIDKPQTRTFTLDPKGKVKDIRYLFTIDGQASRFADKPLEIQRAFSKGVHRIDVFAVAQNHAGLHFEILLDAAEPPFTAAIPPDTFSPEKHPAIAETMAEVPATITAEGDTLTVAFAPGSQARVVRLVLADFETDAPAINAITLTDAKGNRVLPTEKSFADLARNDVLEIIPGDKVTVGYDDPATITPQRKSQERFLAVTFTDAEVSAAVAEFTEVGGERRVSYVPLRRFKPGDPVQVFINDPDMDTGAGPDRLAVTVKAGRGQPVKIDAVETGEHTGIFVGVVFPVAGQPQRPTEITVGENDDLAIAYLDRENTSPGIPWERTATVEQVGKEPPAVFIYDVASRQLSADEIAKLPPRVDPPRKAEEQVAVCREIVAVRPASPTADEPARALVDGPILVEVIHPAIAQTAKSKAELFVQTEAGRRKLGRPVAEGEFPLDAPGTIRLSRTPGVSSLPPLPPGAGRIVVTGNRQAGDPLGDGRFTFSVPTALGPLPERSLADEPPSKSADAEPPVLQLRGDDVIHVGYRYTDAVSGEERWLVRRIALSAEPLFDVMDQRYRETVEGTHVGDSLHVRLVDPSLDTSDDKDVATAKITTEGGVEQDLSLVESFGHSGIFKGSFVLAYRDPAAKDIPPPAATAGGQSLPVTYGETVTVRHDPGRAKPLERKVLVFKGGDANLVPFTKQFKDPEIAVQTQFTVAESWFELAKRHRELGQESLARREIAQGKKLLEEAIADYPNTQARAQADYLLANLAFEFSKDSANEELARQYAMDAVARFSDIVSSHPDSEYAPKSQFKKALVLEKLGQIDQACEEYVKLSYRYPDNELVAETIARLGQYFLGKGKVLDKEAEGQADPVEKEKILVQSRGMFTTAAQVFSRLSERFPQHALATKTRLLAAQCYLRAKDLDRSQKLFETVAKDPKTDKDSAAEAMYWAGDICLQKNDPKNAYRAFKKLTWDYPESKWAKFARGRLTEDALIAAETQLQKEGG